MRIRDEWQVPCLYVTHNVGEALAVAERLVLLQDGAVQADGAHELLGAPECVREAAGRSREPVCAAGSPRHHPERA